MEQLCLPGAKFRRRKPPPPLERRTHIALADLLHFDLAPGWWWSHIASEGQRSEAGRRLQSRMGLKRGLPDFMFIGPSGVYFLELKRGNLGRMSEGQNEFAEVCRRCGIPYSVARSFDEAAAQFSAWGVLSGRAKLA